MLLKPFELPENVKFTGPDLRLKTLPTHLVDSSAQLAAIKKAVQANAKVIRKAQKKMYADKKYAVLCVFQAMDAGGKDSMITHVFEGVDPIGFQTANFKQPTSEELTHDYLWRVEKQLPPRGYLGVFNRSHYEDVLVQRVHPELVLKQELPGIVKTADVTEAFWQLRYSDIRYWEEYLNRQGYLILKFFLNISKEEQASRFKGRLAVEKKNYKLSANDVKERDFWPQYQDAYERAINNTATPANPWYVIPADDKWYSRYLVSNIISQAISQLPLDYPVLAPEEKQRIIQELKF